MTDAKKAKQEPAANTCAKCKNFCFAEVKIGAHTMKTEPYGYCLAYDLFPVYPSVVFCPRYKDEEVKP